jgi:glycosyltransferase involved in cell wall biosynthesis
MTEMSRNVSGAHYPQPGATVKHVCMVTHSYYESDHRVMRYAEALAQRGDIVEVLALRRTADLPTTETVNGVTLFRLQDRFRKSHKTRFSYLWPSLRFLFACWLWMARRYRAVRCDVVHVHNVPDYLVFAAWQVRLKGASIVLDIHDVLPEFFMSKFDTSSRSMAMWSLKRMEKASAAMADHVILGNDLWIEKYTGRSAPRAKCSAIINYVDPELFDPRLRTKLSGPPLIMFPGGLQWHQGVDLAIRAFHKLRRRIPSAEFHIYGDGSMKPALRALAAQLRLESSVRFFKPLSIRDIAGVMANADLGVVPKRADSFGNEAYSTKIMEFMALGVPVVVSSTKVDRHYFDDSVVRFFESGNEDALCDAMFDVLTNETMRAAMVARATEYVERNSWQEKKAAYLQLVDSLVSRTRDSVPSMAST